MFRVPAVLVGILACLPVATAPRAEEVGNAQAVVASASASGEIGERVLATGSVIHLNDLLTTDGTGEVQLLFADDTRMVVGPNASLVIDQFVFRGDKAENSFAVRALGGAFRFIGGKKDDTDYAIRTPSATIGIRGTAFDFAVSSEGTDLLLLEGVATLCGLDGRCAITGETCGVLQAPVGQAASIAEESDRVRLASRRFPFIQAEERLLEGFQLQGESCLSSRSSSRVFGRDVPEREIRAMMEPPDPPAPEPPAPQPPAPEPVAPDPPAPRPEPPAPVEPARFGNPGNRKPVGRAGLNPGGKDFGPIGRGRSDVASARGGPGAAGRGGGSGAGAGAGGGSASGSSGGGGSTAGGADAGGAGGAAAGGQGSGRGAEGNNAGGRGASGNNAGGPGASGNNAGGRGKGRGNGVGGGRSASADAGNDGPGRGRGRGQGGGNGNGGAGSQR